MADIKNDMRSEERFPYLRTITYTCLQDNEQDFKGVTIDISKAGMSLYIFSPFCLSVGRPVKVNDDLPLSSTSGVVRWVRQIDRDLYRAGLKFH